MAVGANFSNHVGTSFLPEYPILAQEMIFVNSGKQKNRVNDSAEN
jgi:hypothetical protein